MENERCRNREKAGREMQRNGNRDNQMEPKGQTTYNIKETDRKNKRADCRFAAFTKP
jgi:hypothetical protein